MADALMPGSTVKLAQFTPTEYAEEAYQAKLRQNRPMPIGPAGLEIPSPMAIYRPTIDKALLPKMCKAAYREHRARVLPQSAHDEASIAAAREMERLYPAADMAVLERYQGAVTVDRVTLDLLTPAKSIWWAVGLPEPTLAPKNIQIGLYVDLGGSQRAHVPPAPADLEAYGRRVAQVMAEEGEFNRPLGWASQFKVQHGRWPKWLEIERAFPRLGEWLAAQRAAIQATPTSADTARGER